MPKKQSKNTKKAQKVQKTAESENAAEAYYEALHMVIFELCKHVRCPKLDNYVRELKAEL